MNENISTLRGKLRNGRIPSCHPPRAVDRARIVSFDDTRDTAAMTASILRKIGSHAPLFSKVRGLSSCLQSELKSPRKRPGGGEGEDSKFVNIKTACAVWLSSRLVLCIRCNYHVASGGISRITLRKVLSTSG